jgi:hypothetical protein
MAQAASAANPDAALGALAAESGGDPPADARLRVVLARRSIAAGRDPEEDVAAGLSSAKGDEPWARELRGILLAARLRRLAPSGRDEESLYREVLDLLGDAPAGWTGRIARLEARLGLSLRLERRREPSRAALEEAVSRANALSANAPSWSAPRICRAVALSRLGSFADAWAELAPIVGGERAEQGGRPAEAQALIAAAELWLRMAERRRREGAPSAEEHVRGRGFAAAAMAVHPDHPEALALAAAAELAAAEEPGTKGPDASALAEDAVRKLDRALRLLPG